MGTYTTNYNLFMPTVGETGWGELVNGNFATIDTTMTGLNTRIGTLETTVEELTSTIEVDENRNVTFYGTISCDVLTPELLDIAITEPTNLEIYTVPSYDTNNLTYPYTNSFILPKFISKFKIPTSIPLNLVTRCGNDNASNMYSTTTVTFTDNDTNEVLYNKTMDASGPKASETDDVIVYYNPYHINTIDVIITTSSGGWGNSRFTATPTEYTKFYI